MRLPPALDKLRVEGVLPYCTLPKLGSLLDESGNAIAATVNAPLKWMRTPIGESLWTTATASGYLAIGNPVGLQLSTLTMFALFTRSLSNAVDNAVVISRANFILSGFFLAAEPRPFGIYDYGGAAIRSSGYNIGLDNRVHFAATTLQSGVANGSAFYIDGAPRGNFTWTLVDQLQSWMIVRGSGANAGLGGGLLALGFASRVLSNAELAEIEAELRWPYLPGFSSRLRYRYPSMSNAEYVAKGIVLDCQGRRLSTTSFADETNNYPGTQAGIVLPGKEGGALLPAATSDISFGNVTQFNSVAQFEVEQVFDLPAGNIPNSTLGIKFVDANNYIFFGHSTGAAANPATLHMFVSNGLPFRYVQTDAAWYLRSNCRHHVIYQYNGLGGVNAKAAIYVDGDLATLTYPAGDLPASTANLAAASFSIGGGASTCPSTIRMMRVSTQLRSAADCRKAYLEWAHRVDWQANGEGMPVTLANVAAPAHIYEWELVSGTWAITEDATGKRWLECVTAGVVARPQPNAFGTWSFTVMKVNAATEMWVLPVASVARAYNDASQNGYGFWIGNFGLQTALLSRLSAGVDTTLMRSPGAYVAVNTTYQVTINCRASDGRFTAYIKGGVYLVATLIDSSGGGSNPTAADATHVASTWCVFQAAPGDKLLIFNPNGNQSNQFRHPIHYAGQLDPTAGEIP